MEFVAMMIFVMVAYGFAKYIFSPIDKYINKYINYLIRLPKNRRDRNVSLEAGQIWTDDWRYWTIVAVQNNNVNISFYINYSNYNYSNYNTSSEEFRKIVINLRLYLTTEIPRWR